MRKKKIVIALGHEALGTTLPEQMEATKRTARAVADFIREDYQVVITHSNGPQVGMIHTAMNEFGRLYPEYTATPMSVCSAMSQGYIGYDLQNAIRAELLNRGIFKAVSTILTQVVVDPYDEAFYKPTKIIGRVMSGEEAEIEERKGNHVVKVGEGYRRIVAAPKPTDIVEIDAIRALADADQVVVACGGGGIPVLAQDNRLKGASAVIEKDLAAGRLAELLDADRLVISASINKSGVLTLRATRVGENTTLAQMIRLVDEAASSKAPIAKLADKVAGVFVPVVMAIALVTAVIWMIATGSVERALTSGVAVLVISCPCALGLATPVAIMVGTGKGAENGILVKSAEALETLHTINTVVLDKTGTLTQGKPQVTDILPAEGLAENALLGLAACLEAPSEHPLGAAIVEEASERKLPQQPVEGFEAVHGRGVRAVLGGHTCLAGSRAMMEEAGIDLIDWLDRTEALAAQGKTPLFFAKDTSLLGVIAVADTPKPTSKTLPCLCDSVARPHSAAPTSNNANTPPTAPCSQTMPIHSLNGTLTWSATATKRDSGFRAK